MSCIVDAEAIYYKGEDYIYYLLDSKTKSAIYRSRGTMRVGVHHPKAAGISEIDRQISDGLIRAYIPPIRAARDKV